MTRATAERHDPSEVGSGPLSTGAREPHASHAVALPDPLGLKGDFTLGVHRIEQLLQDPVGQRVLTARAFAEPQVSISSREVDRLGANRPTDAIRRELNG